MATRRDKAEVGLMDFFGKGHTAYFGSVSVHDRGEFIQQKGCLVPGGKGQGQGHLGSKALAIGKGRAGPEPGGGA